MNIDGLVFGLLDTSQEIGGREAAAPYREFTICWSRYGYQDVIIERQTVDAILDEASGRGFRYCFIQPYGHVIQERWTPDKWQAPDFMTALDASIRRSDFLVIGPLVEHRNDWFGFEPGCLLIDLERYRQLSSPRFTAAGSVPQELPGTIPVREGGRIVALRGSADPVGRTPRLPGWPLIAASLREGHDVTSFGRDVRHHSLDLQPASPQHRAAFSPYLGDGIHRYRGECASELSPDQHAFLRTVHQQTANARRGVFLWNIEAYDDIELPPPGFHRPVSTLYSVAAGFKPNRILHSHGFAEDTRVVYFDYSPNALNVRRCLVEQWNGDNFPDFVRVLFQTFPYPDTFYQLWDHRTPDDVDWDDVAEVWQREVDRWGGRAAFRDHWRRYRELPHTYVCCNLLQDPGPLLETMIPESSAVIWWSNAFFTMYGNWFFPWDERQRAYQDWVDQLATCNPQLHLYGSDSTNANVNCIQAAEYRQLYGRDGGDYLQPALAYRTRIRM